MTKKELLEKKIKLLERHSTIVRNLKNSWEIAHQNGLAVYELSILIDKYAS